jgi:hypothetical protein
MGTILPPWRYGEIRQYLSQPPISRAQPSAPNRSVTGSLAHLQLGKTWWSMLVGRPPMQTYNGGAIESGKRNRPSGLLMSLLRGIAVHAASMARSPWVMVADFGTCIVRSVFRIRSVRTTCRAARLHETRLAGGGWPVAVKTHLAGGGWRAIVQDIAIRIKSAFRALRKRRGRQSDRHQRCGTECFVVYHRGFHR